MTEPEKLDLTSHNLPEDKKQELLRLFPEIRTEGGKIDFDKLKLVLGETIDVGRERYGMTWPGKADVFKTIQTPSMGTLLPAPDESVNFDTTENLIIEGDNLEVLKLLQKSYLGKVKMIYIDPPYNTGNDFIYPDSYAESLQTYLEYTGQVDAEGKKFGTNTDTDGRFHSRWINMMYPRLYLAKNLLREDGAIFISIDESEHPTIRSLCNEILGEENFIADMVWAAGRKNDSTYVSMSHEYIIVYAKNKAFLKENNIIWRIKKEGLDEIYSTFDKLSKKYGKDFKKIQLELREWYSGLPDTHPSKRHRHYSSIDKRGIYFPDNISWPGGGGPKYEVLHPLTKKPCSIPSRGWMFAKPEKMAEAIADDRVHFGDDETSVPCIKSYLKDREFEVPYSVFYQDGRASTKRLRELLKTNIFENPKDEVILEKMIEFAGDENAIILDFFAGSGTTAHAVFELNKRNNGNQKFILVQLPEPTSDEEYPTIVEITKERVRRVIKKLNDEEAGQLPMGEKQDRGFRVFKLAESNFRTWDSSNPKDSKALEKQLELHIEHIREGRSSEDILYEILLKSGFPLTTSVEKIELAGKSVYSVSDGGMFICLEKELTMEVIRAMAEKHPQRVVCLDLGFAGNDQLKTNAVQIFKNKEIVFKTV